MSARVTRKRARIDSEADQPPAGKVEENGQPISQGDAAADAVRTENVKRDEEFWFSDGTVILVAQDVEFRVYKRPLEDSSSVFKDMLARSQETRLLELCGQRDFPCLVVHLTDSPYDLRHVLRCCMPSLEPELRYFNHDIEPSFAMISACIRLGQKYNFSKLREASLNYLKDCYPSDFPSWSHRLALNIPISEKVQVIGVVNLARLTGELSILPSALLACIVLLTGEELVEGFLREDGSKESLTKADLALCFNAKSRLSVVKASLSFRILSLPVSPSCCTRSVCTDLMGHSLRCPQADTVDLTSGYPFAYHEMVCDDGSTLCHECETMLRDREEEEHLIIWNRLPELLGINVPGWPSELS